MTNQASEPSRPDGELTDEKRRLRDLLDALRALGPVGEVQKREPFEFPDRRGL